MWAACCPVIADLMPAFLTQAELVVLHALDTFLILCHMLASKLTSACLLRQRPIIMSVHITTDSHFQEHDIKACSQFFITSAQVHKAKAKYLQACRREGMSVSIRTASACIDIHSARNTILGDACCQKVGCVQLRLQC